MMHHMRRLYAFARVLFASAYQLSIAPAVGYLPPVVACGLSGCVTTG